MASGPDDVAPESCVAGVVALSFLLVLLPPRFVLLARAITRCLCATYIIFETREDVAMRQALEHEQAKDKRTLDM